MSELERDGALWAFATVAGWIAAGIAFTVLLVAGVRYAWSKFRADRRRAP